MLELDIGRITVLGQPEQKSFLDPHLKGKKLGMVVLSQLWQKA
jgi:hypothetical protein